MAFDYDEMREMAEDLVGPNEFGNTFTLKKPDGKPVYDQKKKKNIQLYKDFPGKCVMTIYTVETIGSLSNIINAGDAKFVCTLDDIEIIPTESEDKIEFGGHIYNVLHVFTVDPCGKKVVVHTIHARRAV